jgi:hypothetical protein
MMNKLRLSRLHSDIWLLHFKHPAHTTNWHLEAAAPIEFWSCTFAFTNIFLILFSFLALVGHHRFPFLPFHLPLLIPLLLEELDYCIAYIGTPNALIITRRNPLKGIIYNQSLIIIIISNNLGKPATNCLNYGTAVICSGCSHLSSFCQHTLSSYFIVILLIF